MKIIKNIWNIANASLVLLISASPIATGMEDGTTSTTSTSPYKLKVKEVSGLRDHEYYEAEFQKLDESTRRIHEEVDRILKEFREHKNAYYQHIRGTTLITGKKEKPAKDREKEEAKKYYDLGVQDENEGKIEEAKQNYEIAAIQGYPPAQFALGDILYEEGDTEKATYWGEMAAGQGFGMAQILLGIISHNEGDTKKAKYWWEMTADQDYEEPQFLLGNILHEEGDTEKAKYWWEMAAYQEYKEAQLALGIILDEEGKTDEAKYWLERAAVQGSDMAQFILGDIFYREGIIEEDREKIDEAKYWWEKLAKQGGNNNYHGNIQHLININKGLMDYIQELLIHGNILYQGKKIKEAKEYYQLAVNLGDDEAKTILEKIQKEGE